MNQRNLKAHCYSQQVQELFHYENEVTKGFVMGVGMVSALPVIGDEFPLEAFLHDQLESDILNT